jgi:hypothetical protein
MLTATMAKLACKGLPVRSYSWVDNVRFAGNAAEVKEAGERFIKISESLNLRLHRETGDEPVTEYNFLGLHYDHTRRAVCLADKTKKKLERLERILQNKLRQVLAMSCERWVLQNLLRYP